VNIRVNMRKSVVFLFEIPPNTNTYDVHLALSSVGLAKSVADSRNPPVLFVTYKMAKNEQVGHILRKLKGMKSVGPRETEMSVLKKTMANTAKLLSPSEAKQYLLQLRYHIYPRNMFTNKVKQMIFWV